MNWRIGILTASGVALAGAGALWLANQGSDEADPGPDPDPDPDPDTSWRSATIVRRRRSGTPDGARFPRECKAC